MRFGTLGANWVFSCPAKVVFEAMIASNSPNYHSWTPVVRSVRVPSPSPALGLPVEAVQPHPGLLTGDTWVRCQHRLRL